MLEFYVHIITLCTSLHVNVILESEISYLLKSNMNPEYSFCYKMKTTVSNYSLLERDRHDCFGTGQSAS